TIKMRRVTHVVRSAVGYLVFALVSISINNMRFIVYQQELFFGSRILCCQPSCRRAAGRAPPVPLLRPRKAANRAPPRAFDCEQQFAISGRTVPHTATRKAI